MLVFSSLQCYTTCMQTIYLSHLHDQAFRAKFHQKQLACDQLVTLTGRTSIPLEGPWRLCPDQYDTCLRAGWYAYTGKETTPVDCDFEFWKEVIVPSVWNTEHEPWEYYEGSMLYRTEFASSQKEGTRTFLVFEGVANRAYVFLNGIYLGFHEGASTPFSVEITASLQDRNTLLVCANNTRSVSSVPSENTDWFNYGGIYRQVHLMQVPPSFIRHWYVRLLDAHTLGIDIELSGIHDSVQVVCKELGLSLLVAVHDHKASVQVPFTGQVWDIENPKRYTFCLQYGQDRVEDTIGLRTIACRGNQILLNDKPIFLRGVCLHEDHPDFGRYVNENLVRRSLEDAKLLGCNCIRLSHYPHHRYMAEIADELGMLLWEELPVYWAIAFSEPAVLADAKNQLSELILRDRNRCSVIIWSVGNENPDTDERLAFMSSLASLARSLDPSRLVGAACLVNEHTLCIQDRLEACLDVIGLNEYYGWYDPDMGKLKILLEHSLKDKPVLITEFGAGAKAGFHDAEAALFSEERQALFYKQQFVLLLGSPTVSGTFPWLLYDFRSPRRMNKYQGGYNRKGLIDQSRRHKKLAYATVQTEYRRIKEQGR